MVSKGKFKGWRATVWKSEVDKRDKWRYYDLHADYRKTKTGRINASDVGLGQMIDIPEQSLRRGRRL